MNISAKSYAKVNIFLKIAGKRDNYHELVSRFVRVKNLYDTITIIPENPKGEFTLMGDFGCPLEKNTIYKAFLELRKNCPKIDAYFRIYSIKVDKKIPEFAGLGGGSSNAATFLIMANKLFDLYYSKEKLAKIGAKIGADVPFFVYEYDSANVTGIGEIVEKYEEEALDIEVVTPKIECNTGKIFTSFREKFYKEVSLEEKDKLLNMNSKDILKELNISSANDLYEPALDTYPLLKEYEKENWFFSGSGSSFFKVKNNG
ncbi:4-(cytidine 5'-diphospho)-2-C-methyl-D-erythritol kinase [Arcobacter sp.]|uniref:4-(cytidine 5'-diphospho)-2-C-methyl-D-erythritol kinase n=1 Tax=Arcobacter sp. TaxID=1872629 RepID=UPI003D0E0868